MSCRAKTLCYFLLRLSLFTLFCSDLIWAKAVVTRVDDQPRLTSYPPIIHSLWTGPRQWAPDLSISPECKQSLQDSRQLNTVLCEQVTSLGWYDKLQSKFLIAFDTSDTKKFNRLVIEPRSGLKIRGLLGLQKNKQGQIETKPLVIFRLGVHGNSDEILAEKYLIKIIYEDLGYHVLVLENLTSHGFLSVNDQISIGGIEEGLHTFYILNMITHGQFDWSKAVTNIHIGGISLGGPGSFVATYLSEQSLYKNKSIKKVKSTQLFCPVVNLPETFEYHHQRGLFSAVIDLWNVRRTAVLREKNKELEDVDWWLTIFDWKPRYGPAIIRWLDRVQPKPVLSYKLIEKDFPDVQLPDAFKKHVDHAKSFYDLNRFWEIYKNDEIPIVVNSTVNDPVVPNALNSEMIRSQKQPGEFKNIRFVDLRGVHCALAGEYQWPFLVELVKRGF